MKLCNLKIYTENGILDNGCLEIDSSRISSISIGESDGIDCSGLIAIPGFIDQHIHGANGSDFMDPTKEAIQNIVAKLPQEGITSVAATTVSMKKEDITTALHNLRDYIVNENKPGESHILGVHLEGPFLSEKYRGAHKMENLSELDIDLFTYYQKESGNNIIMATYAPEKKGGVDFTKHLIKNKVVPSIGHSAATYNQVVEVYELGVRNITHFYNVMSSYHHRNPGVVNAGLHYDDLMLELITDGVHVHPEVIHTTYKIKGTKGITLVTDSMGAKWLPEGSGYQLGGEQVTVKNGEVRMANGNLAGSVLKGIDGFINFMNYTNCSIEEAIQVMSVNPAKTLKVFDKKGSLSQGKDADIILLNKDLQIEMTICRGEVSYKRD